MRLRPTSARNRDEQSGFSLIELMVVLLIIAILLGVAIPTYLAARDRAENRAAQESLRTGLVTLESVYTEYQTFETLYYAGYTGSGGKARILPSVEPALKWSTIYSYGPNDVAVGNLGNNAAIEVVRSDSRRCFWLMDVKSDSAQIIGSHYFDSSTITGPGVWYASQSPGGSNGQCVLGLNSPRSWSLSSMKGWR